MRVVTCAAGAAWEAPLVRGLQRRELGVEVLRRCVDHGELLGVALRDRPRAAVVAAELPWLDRELVGSLHDAGVAVVALGSGSSMRTIEAVGVSYRLPADASVEDVARLLHGLGRDPEVSPDRSTVDAGSGGGGRLVAVWGASGAPGRTTVALHLALELAAGGTSTVLVDGDAWAPSIAQLLGLRPSPGIVNAASDVAAGRSDPLVASVQEGPSGLVVLAGLARAELWPEVRERSWLGVLDAARDRAEVVVTDLASPIEEDEELSFDRAPYRRNHMSRTALSEASSVVLVVAADPLGLRRGIYAHRSLVEAFPSIVPRVVPVMNRAPSSARRRNDGIALIEQWMGIAPSFVLPAEPAFEHAVWEGRPLHAVAPRSRWLRALRDLTGALAAGGDRAPTSASVDR